MIPGWRHPAGRFGWLLGAALLLLILGLLVRSLERPAPSPTSDADARIAYYRARLGGRGTYPAYARLGAAYLQKAQESGDSRYYDQAAEHLSESLQMQRHYEASHWLAAVRLAQHRFREALELAQEASASAPGDLDARGLLFDAHLALGDVSAAQAVAEQMMQMQAGFASLARLVALREYQGDLAGALEAARRACGTARTDALPAAARAWCQVRLGSLALATCDAETAVAAYQQSLTLFPGYHLALEHLAELRAAQGRRGEAADIYRQLIARNDSPQHRLALADLFELDGNAAAARGERAQALGALRASAESGALADLRLLALLLLDTQETAAEGLRWAEKDWENRRDAFAADTLAWAYFHNGRIKEAAQTMEAALAAGSRNPVILTHGAAILQKTGQPARARKLVEQALACPLALSPPDRAALEKLRALF